MISRLANITESMPYRHLLWNLNNAILEKIFSCKLGSDKSPISLERLILITRDLVKNLKTLEIWPVESDHPYKYWPLTSPFYEYEYDH
jgi:hypothetical protein